MWAASPTPRIPRWVGPRSSSTTGSRRSGPGGARASVASRTCSRRPSRTCRPARARTGARPASSLPLRERQQAAGQDGGRWSCCACSWASCRFRTRTPRDLGSRWCPRAGGHGITRAVPSPPSRPASGSWCFDLETQRSAAEVGGWHRADRMGLAAGRGLRRAERAPTARTGSASGSPPAGPRPGRPRGRIQRARFDLRVLSGYVPWDLSRIRFFDLLSEVRGPPRLPPSP
jgi:hypothetical protein